MHGYFWHEIYNTHTNFIEPTMNVRKDSPFSLFMLRRVIDKIWCGQIVAYWVVNLVAKALKLSTKLGGSQVNQRSAPSWRKVGKTLYRTILFIM